MRRPPAQHGPALRGVQPRRAAQLGAQLRMWGALALICAASGADLSATWAHPLPPPSPQTAEVAQGIAPGAPEVSAQGVPATAQAQALEVAQGIAPGAPEAEGGPLWRALCADCHGLTGAGDGPARAWLDPPPPPLAGEQSALAAHAEALRIFLKQGRPERGMPAFAALEGAPLDALIAHVRALAASPAQPQPARPPTPDRGPADWPAHTPPLQREPSALHCGRCHPQEAAGWQHSQHARAMGPGVTGQWIGAPERAQACTGCHAPAAEQGAELEGAFAAEGVSCVACHRAGGQLVAAPHTLRPRQPTVRSHVRRDERLGRSVQCAPCHQHPARAGAEAPLLDTWREWARSPYQAADLQCTHCHMPGADHRVLGVHDPQTVRRAVTLQVQRREAAVGVLDVWAQLRNVGAGHHFPTTPTPRAVLTVYQATARGPLEATRASWAVGRTLGADGRSTVADTRIPAGEAIERRYRWRRQAEASALVVELWMFPDWHYARLFRAALRAPLAAAAAQALGEAHRSAEESGFLVHQVRVPL